MLIRFFCFISILHPSFPLSINSHSDDRIHALADTSRRGFILGLACFPTIFGLHQVSSAEDEIPPFQLSIQVILPSKIDKEQLLGPDTALFVTARPVIVSDDQIPPELIMKYAKVPPVLTKKVDFPKDFRVILGLNDATPEGQQWNGWEHLPLTVSARLDTDGIASTRNSTDLVGRISPVPPGSQGTINLQGRGFVGKLLKWIRSTLPLLHV